MRANRTGTGHQALRVLGLLGSAAAVAVMVASLAFVLPSLLGMQRYVITGGSMSGTFERGSVVFDEVVPVSDLHVGDVITYQPPASSGLTELVTHRIAAIRHTPGGVLYRTKGDANDAADPWQFRLDAATQPRASFHVPEAGYLFLALGDRSIRMLVVGVPAAVIALYSLLELVRALRAPAGELTPARPSHRRTSQDRPAPVHHPLAA